MIYHLSPQSPDLFFSPNFGKIIIFTNIVIYFRSLNIADWFFLVICKSITTKCGLQCSDCKFNVPTYFWYIFLSILIRFSSFFPFQIYFSYSILSAYAFILATNLHLFNVSISLPMKKSVPAIKIIYMRNGQAYLLPTFLFEVESLITFLCSHSFFFY